MRPTVGTAALAALLLLAPACGSEEPTQRAETPAEKPAKAPATGSGGDSVTIKGFAFQPGALEVASGTELSVVNEDDAAHTLTADDGSFDTGNIDGKSEGSVVVEGTGDVPYHCTIHDYMKGTLTVT